ncbi:hypothetical protein BN1723_016931 [Verticillium longisporum]|uniref:Uncharacterized protein n=1 Tax=Verticillium longisporum TaxID=100787 RepID=A0A0G4NQN3_VERLO|nr:hypothetical protein BN1723_016931 [Verticillium longisporum]
MAALATLMAATSTLSARATESSTERALASPLTPPAKSRS